jgi:predicted nucleotidyltransferase
MVKKSVIGIPLDVKKAIAQMDKETKVILFGSRARGDSGSDSDWDFLILTSKETTQAYQDRIREILYKIELATGQVITSIIENKKTWDQYTQTEFYKNVARDGIEIIPPKAA